MSNLGFNPENVMVDIDPAMKMLVQANTPLTEQDLRTTLTTIEIIEAFDVARGSIIDHITPELVTPKHGRPVTIGIGKKRKKDPEFKAYWHDIAEEVGLAVYTHFTRRVELKTAVKESIHPMIRRVMKLVILPVIVEFSNHSPETILKSLDTKETGLDGKDIFGYMARFMAHGPAETQPTNVLVARKILQKRCSTIPVKVIDRRKLIKAAVQKVQEKAE